MELVACVLLITGLICVCVIIGAKHNSSGNERNISAEELSMKAVRVDYETENCSLIDVNDVDQLNVESIDPLFEEVSRYVVDCQQDSATAIQRRFSIGFNRAGHLVDQFEAAGILGPRNKFGEPRQVVDSEALELILKTLQPIISQAQDNDAEAKRIQQEINEQMEREEIAARIKEKYRRRQLEKIVRQELIDSGELFGDQPKRPQIPREVVDAVYKRDGGRCVYCGSTQNLQLDHIIPFSRGGATTLENMQLLCQKCNLEKSNKIG